ncbi:MAG: hypothetical protein A2309_09310 [Bacteroidetes bacterium RIFOXYB2_FULL_35_7]|nr:MAG: hypothetical protein A2309_09310 [Bacteroidetes bacterium RIFOXYB2_FULL_35_7]
MHILSLLSFIVFILYFGAGIFVLGQNFRSHINRSFFYFTLAISIWSYAYVFLYQAEYKESVFYWDRIASIGWTSFPALLVFFYSKLTKQNALIIKIIVWLFVILSIVFIYKSFTSHLLTSDWYYNNFTWIPFKENTSSLWYWAFNIFMIISVLLSVWMIFDWRKKENSKRVKIQSKIFLITLGISIIGGYSTNFIAPIFNLGDIPNVAHIISIFWVGGVGYSIMKYRLMVLTPKVAANEIVSNMKELLFFVDSHDKIIRVNKFTEDILETEDEYIVGKSIDYFFKEKEKIIEELILEKIQHQKPVADFTLIPVSGINIPVELSFSTIHDNTGDIIGTVIVGHDIRQKKQLEEEIFERKTAQTDLKNAHDELEKRVIERTYDLTNVNHELIYEITEHKKAKTELLSAKQKAEEADRLKTAFLANMSHEIRTPLNGMLGFSDLLKDPTLTSEEREEYIEIIKNCGDHLLDLINDIIDISKIEAGQLIIDKSLVDINILLKEIHVSFEGIIKGKINKDVQILLTQMLEEETPKRMVDELRLRQILTNLIGNAIKFTNQGSIEVGCIQYDNTTLQFYVRDTGIGISQDKKEQIFQRFVQADNSFTKKFGGTGLGLAICQQLVELMDGKIWVDSEEGKGSVFYFTVSVYP